MATGLSRPTVAHTAVDSAGPWLICQRQVSKQPMRFASSYVNHSVLFFELTEAKESIADPWAHLVRCADFHDASDTVGAWRTAAKALVEADRIAWVSLHPARAHALLCTETDPLDSVNLLSLDPGEKSNARGCRSCLHHPTLQNATAVCISEKRHYRRLSETYSLSELACERQRPRAGRGCAFLLSTRHIRRNPTSASRP